ncbi:MAG: PilZ domain-containing protein, partial [Planctomycetes bacterium]|nr:PilZ domain-containing protein [Planctomycetota bacterium]
MKISKIIRGYPGQRLSFTCDNCHYKKSIVAKHEAGYRRVLKCSCGARIGLVVERREHRRVTLQTPMVGIISDGEIYHDVRIKDISHEGLGLELTEAQPYPAKGSEVKIVFSPGDPRSEIVKDTITIV